MNKKCTKTHVAPLTRRRGDRMRSLDLQLQWFHRELRWTRSELFWMRWCVLQSCIVLIASSNFTWIVLILTPYILSYMRCDMFWLCITRNSLYPAPVLYLHNCINRAITKIKQTHYCDGGVVIKSNTSRSYLTSTVYSISLESIFSYAGMMLKIPFSLWNTSALKDWPRGSGVGKHLFL